MNEQTVKPDLTQTFDARVWVTEWLKTIAEHPDIPHDEGAMIAWLANAIMAGYDHAKREIGEPSLSVREAAEKAAYEIHRMFALRTNRNVVEIEAIITNVFRDFVPRDELEKLRGLKRKSGAEKGGYGAADYDEGYHAAWKEFSAELDAILRRKP